MTTKLLPSFGIFEPQSPLSEQQVMMLSTYNAEVARGIMHTPEWKETMRRFQSEWEKQFDGLTRLGPFVILPDKS